MPPARSHGRHNPRGQPVADRYLDKATGEWVSLGELRRRQFDNTNTVVIIPEWLQRKESADPLIDRMREYAQAAGIRDFEQYLPEVLRSVDNQGEAQVVDERPLSLHPPGADTTFSPGGAD